MLPEDESAWPAALAGLMRDADRRAELARLGRARIEEQFTFARRMEKVFALYDGLLAGEAGRAGRRP